MVGQYTLAAGEPCKLVTATAKTVAGKHFKGGARDGAGPNARFAAPFGLDLSSDETFVLVADINNNAIRKVIVATGAVSTIARGISRPHGLAIAKDTSFALVCANEGHNVLKLDLRSNKVTQLAGRNGHASFRDGVGDKAYFYYPIGVGLSADDNFALVADYKNHRIRQINLRTRYVSTLAGSSAGLVDGAAARAKFSLPYGVTIHGASAYVADFGNGRIRKINLSTKVVSTIAKVSRALYIAISHDGSFALVTHSAHILKLDLKTVAVTRILSASQRPCGIATQGRVIRAVRRLLEQTRSSAHTGHRACTPGSYRHLDLGCKACPRDWSTNRRWCAKCGYRLSSDKSRCLQNGCKCENGTPMSGPACTKAREFHV